MGNTLGGFGLPTSMSFNNYVVTGSMNISGTLSFEKQSDLSQNFTNTMHVTTNGTDIRDGLSKYSFIHPYQTVQTALASSSAGDLIWVHSGVYMTGNVILKNSVNLHFDAGSGLRDNSSFPFNQNFITDNGVPVNCVISGKGIFKITDNTAGGIGFPFELASTGSNIIIYCDYISGVGVPAMSIDGANVTLYGNITGSAPPIMSRGSLKIINSYINFLSVGNLYNASGYGETSGFYMFNTYTSSIILENCKINIDPRVYVVYFESDCKNKSLSMYNCTFLNGFSSGAIKSAAAGQHISIAHCRSTHEFTSSANSNITNDITTHYNIIDSKFTV